MAKLEGKCGHQFLCINGVAPFLGPFNHFVGGPETALEWDTAKEIPRKLRRTMGDLFERLPSQQVKGSAMWPLDLHTKSVAVGTRD
jgi:hypothetical protein